MTLKKKLIILSAFLFFIISVTVFYSLKQTTTQQSPSATRTESTRDSEEDTQDILIQTPQKPSDSNNERYGTEDVIFLIDNRWRATKDSRTTGDNIVITLREPDSNDPVQSLSIYTETSVPEKRLTELDQLYTALGYRKESRIFLNGVAVQYTGIAPYPVPEKNQINNLQDRTILLVRNQDLYIIKYQYVSDQRLKELDSQFELILTTLEI